MSSAAGRSVPYTSIIIPYASAASNTGPDRSEGVRRTEGLRQKDAAGPVARSRRATTTVSPAMLLSSSRSQTDKVSRRVSHTPIYRPSTEDFSKHQAGITLRQCNDNLLVFIEKARALAEADDVVAGLPSTLKKKISKELLIKDALDKEIQRLREMIASTKINKESRNEHLDALKDIVSGNHKEVKEKEAALEELEEVMRKLKHQEATLLVDVQVSHVRTRNTIEHLESEIAIYMRRSGAPADLSQSSSPGSSMQAEEARALAEEQLAPAPLVLPDERQEDSKEQLVIKIRAEYQAKMKKALDKVRLEYKVDYKVFVKNIQRESEKVLKLMETVMKARQSQSQDKMYAAGLKDLVASRGYESRVEGLRGKVERLGEAVRGQEERAGELLREWGQQGGEVEWRKIQVIEKLRQLLGQFSVFAEWAQGRSQEVDIYRSLLALEDTRLTSRTPKVTASVTEVTSSRREGRRESGYLSNGTKTPDATLDIKEDGRSSPFLTNLRRETMSDPEETEDMAGWEQGGKWYRKM